MVKINFIIYIIFIYVIEYVDILFPTNMEFTNLQMNYKTAALILARGGSKGIYKKNLSAIQNQTLIRRTLDKLFKFNKFDSVWVSTDDADIAEESMKMGALVYRRTDKSASDTATSITAVKEFIHSNPDIDIVALVQCTSPFLRIQDLQTAYQMITNLKFDSVFSATRNYKLHWKIKSDDGSVYAVNFNVTNRPRKQVLSNELTETGMFYFAKSSIVMEKGALQAGKIGFVEVPLNNTLEIDTESDLYVARILAASAY